jgi:hypothetical protein
MNTSALLADLRARGFSLVPVDSADIWVTPSSRLTDADRAAIRTHEPELLAHENEVPFPEALAEFFVRSFCPPGGLVLDCFSGSGTTGAVAVRHGRRFAGCDIRPSQVELSRRRIEAEITSLNAKAEEQR